MGFIERIRTGSLCGRCVGLVPSCMGTFAARPSTNQAGGDDGSLDTTGGRADLLTCRRSPAARPQRRAASSRPRRGDPRREAHALSEGVMEIDLFHRVYRTP